MPTRWRSFFNTWFLTTTTTTTTTATTYTDPGGAVDPINNYFCLLFSRCKEGKEVKHDGKQVIVKQDGGLHSLTLVGVKRGDTGAY